MKKNVIISTNRDCLELYEVKNVIENFARDIHEMESSDSINKLYRQARIWTRFQMRYAGMITEEEAVIINKKFKRIRWDRLHELGFVITAKDFLENESE